MSAPKLTISLISMNSRDMLRGCLQSLYACDQGVTFETILVDNVSTDGSVEMARTEFPQAQVLVNTHLMGFAANHNQALRIRQGDYHLLLNDDTIVRPGALKAMCDYLDAHPEVGAVGCRLENPDGTLQRNCYKFPSPLRSLTENLLLVAAFPNHPRLGDYRAWAHDTEREVDFVSGAALMVRRQALETTGLLDEGFYLYAEETDWCYRMRQDGWKIAFTPAGTILHYGGQSSVGFKERQFCEFTRNQLRFIKKHYGVSGGVVYRLSMLMGAVVRLTVWGSVALVLPKRREKTKTVLALWWRILRWHLGLGPHEGFRELAARQQATAATVR